MKYAILKLDAVLLDVRPLAGAGIEILTKCAQIVRRLVRPLAGAGIEITLFCQRWAGRRRSPPRGGGY